MTTNTAAPATPAEITNLHAAKKAQAAAKKAHPAGTAAPAKAPAEKPAIETKATSTKIKWVLDGERDEKNRAAQHGTGANGVTYAITGSASEWTATATGPDGKVETLGEGVGHTKAYQLCIGHAKGAQVAA